MKQYEVVLESINPEQKDNLILALFYAGYSVYQTENNDIAFTATEEQVTEIKG